MKCTICSREISEKEWNEINSYWYKGLCYVCTNKIIDKKEKMNDKEFLKRLPELKDSIRKR